MNPDQTKPAGFPDLSKWVYLKDKTQAEAVAEAEKLGGRIALNREIDALLNHEFITIRPELLGVWTGTHLDYQGTKCKITENGKTVEREMPIEDGWYEQDEFGLPFGKSSDQTFPSARKLWRLDKNSGLVSRDGGRWGVGGRRDVGADYVPSARRGVFVITR